MTNYTLTIYPRIVPSPSPTYRQIRSKSNSVRGKEFRAKRKKYEADLERQVRQLRAQVDKHIRSRVLDENQLVQTCYSDSGSLSKVIREYFHLFRFGMHDRSSVSSERCMHMAPNIILNKIQRQEQFMHATIDEEVSVGEHRGLDAAIQQWQLHTTAHDSVRVELQRMETIFTEDTTVIKVYAHSHCRIGYNTFKYIAPRALNNHQLMEKFVNREVVYKSVFHFQFNEAGMIVSETAEMDMVQAFLEAGCLLEDIDEFMQLSILSPGYNIPPDVCEIIPASDVEESQSDKLAIHFLLSPDEP